MQYKPHQTTTKNVNLQGHENRKKPSLKNPLWYLHLSRCLLQTDAVPIHLYNGKCIDIRAILRLLIYLTELTNARNVLTTDLWLRTWVDVKCNLALRIDSEGQSFKRGGWGQETEKKSHFLLKRNRRSKYWISKDVWASHVKKWFIKDERIAWRCAKEDKKTAALMDLQM